MLPSVFAPALAAALWVPAALPAASEADADAEQAPPEAVQNRRFTNSGKWEASLSAGVTPVSRLTLHGALDASFGWNITEHWSVHVRGGWAFSRHTSAADDAEAAFQSADPQMRFRTADDFQDLWELNWSALAAARWMPIYGKFSLFSAAVIHFGVWLSLGAGAGGFERMSLISPSLDETAVKPLFLGALGLRFYVTQLFSLDLSFDARLFPDSYRVDIDRADPAVSGRRKTGLSCLSFISLGAVFSF